MILKVSTGIFAIIAGTIFLSGILGGCASARLGITKVAKPDLAKIKVFRPRKQATIPNGLTENPFIDTVQALKGSAIEKKRGYVLFSRPIIKPVYRGTHPLSAERTNGIATFATPGEYEPVTFSFYPLRDLNNVRLVVSSLKSADSTISTSALDMRAVTYWNIRYPRYTSKSEYRAQPELLEKVNTIDLKKNVCQRFWLKIHVPSNAKPGLYKGAVTIYEDGKSNAWQLPVTLRVLDYKLKRDPAKRYSVYYYPPKYQFKKLKGAVLNQARSNELESMRSYGIDMFPTISLGARKGKNKEIELYLRDDDNIEKMLELGFKGPMPVCGGMWNFYKRFVPQGKIGKHWHISKKPENDDIYKDIERAFVDLKKRVAAKGWPKMICCPLDEVSPSSAEFAAKVLAAIRRAGVKTYTTKDPTARDAAVYLKHDSVDVWCSQPFAVPQAKTLTDKRHDYWTYPNHNAGEIKNRVIMQKGGRMTYGFGLWKSGYTTVIPWHWRWLPNKDDQFDYLRGRPLSGCGARMDENQKVIPAVYWECFREGYDDLRYLYTLEDAIVKREGSENKQCRTVVDQGKKLVQAVWNSIPVKKKYLKVQDWTNENFQLRRWQIASLTQKLLKFQAVNSKTAPSVPAFVNTKISSSINEEAFISKSLKNGWIDQFNLAADDYKFWKAVNAEASKKVILGTPSTLQFDVLVNHKIDGGGEKGKYPIGWPRISRIFKKGALDLTKYDYLYFKVKVDSNRSEVEDDTTPFIVNFAAQKKSIRYDVLLDLGDKPRVWIPVELSIAEMMSRSGFTKPEWSDLRIIQLVLAESHYRDGTKMSFEIQNLALLKFNRPILQQIICDDVMIRSEKNIVIEADGYGFVDGAKRHDSLILTVMDSNQRNVFSLTAPLTTEPRFILDASKLEPGEHKLILTVLGTDGKKVSLISKKITVINGFE